MEKLSYEERFEAAKADFRESIRKQAATKRVTNIDPEQSRINRVKKLLKGVKAKKNAETRRRITNPVAAAELEQRLENIKGMLLHSPTDMIITYFGEEGLKALKKVRIDARTVYEPTDTDTQCEETIGRVDHRTTCWLCNELLWPEGCERDAQCEHKLAIAQAVYFLELYIQSSRAGFIHKKIPRRHFSFLCLRFH
jgi:hypothetical protein